MAMRIFFIFLLVLVHSLPAAGKDAQQNSDDAEKQLEQEIRERDEKETSCECCLKCRAATKNALRKEDNGRDGNGCRRCCDLCGENLPLEKDNPPEKLGHQP